MQSCNHQSNRRGLFIAACVIGALIAQTASADCPPGYRNKAGHCIPGPMRTHHPVAIESSVHAPTTVSPVHANKPRTDAHATAVTPVHATTTHHNRPKTAYASHSTHSTGPAPAASTSGYDLRAQHEAKSAHGIIFVGGKQALNPQPIPPGKNALNPQPIPPGKPIPMSENTSSNLRMPFVRRAPAASSIPYVGCVGTGCNPASPPPGTLPGCIGGISPPCICGSIPQEQPAGCTKSN